MPQQPPWSPGLRRRPRSTADGFVLPEPPGEHRAERLGRGTGRDAAVHLVEGGLAEQDHQLRPGQLEGSTIGVEVEHPATRRVEALIHAAEGVPHGPGQEERVRFAVHRQPPVDGRAVEGGDLEQAVAVLRPVDGGQQGLLARHVVPAVRRHPLVDVEAELPAERRNHRPLEHAGPVHGRVQQAGGDEAGAVDHDPDHVTPGPGQPTVDRARRRGRGVLDAQQLEVAVETVEDGPVERGRRAVVDHDDLVGVRRQVALVGGRQRVQRAGCLLRNVEDDDDEGKSRPAPACHPREPRRHGGSLSMPRDPVNAARASWPPPGPPC